MASCSRASIRVKPTKSDRAIFDVGTSSVDGFASIRFSIPLRGSHEVSYVLKVRTEAYSGIMTPNPAPRSNPVPRVESRSICASIKRVRSISAP